MNGQGKGKVAVGKHQQQALAQPLFGVDDVLCVEFVLAQWTIQCRAGRSSLVVMFY
jgi:hypothetical protein